MTWSASRMPRSSMSRTNRLERSPARSSSVEWTWTTRGRPETRRASSPARYVSQSWAWMTSKRSCLGDPACSLGEAKNFRHEVGSVKYLRRCVGRKQNPPVSRGELRTRRRRRRSGPAGERTRRPGQNEADADALPNEPPHETLGRNRQPARDRRWVLPPEHQDGHAPARFAGRSNFLNRSWHATGLRVPSWQESAVRRHLSANLEVGVEDPEDFGDGHGAGRRAARHVGRVGVEPLGQGPEAGLADVRAQRT